MKSIKSKLYVFIIVLVFVLSIGTNFIAYFTNKAQIDSVYKNMTTTNAENFASTLDGDFLAELKVIASSREFQEVRDRAEAEDNNLILQGYMEDLGIWEEYMLTQRTIDRYISKMEHIEYLYVVAHGDRNATIDMFLMDDSSNNLYDCIGRWEDREPAYYGADLTDVEPTISYSDEWGWLVSDFASVYDSDGNAVCIVGCDVNYQDIVDAQYKLLAYSILGSILLAGIAIVVGLFFINRKLVTPLQKIADEVDKFTPAPESTDANVITLDMEDRQDEIGTIYSNIRSNQLRIVDYIKNISEMQEDLDSKDTKISKLSMQSFKDALTNVGNKGAYIQKMKELSTSKENYAIVMVDINNLKEMNDKYGHKAGDWYIQGCCNLICKTFRHSPVYRIGGDEFVVIVDGGDYPNRVLRFEELTKAFEISYEKETEKPWEKLSASCGMAENASDDSSPELVFKRADKAMYASKLEFKKKYGSYR